MPSKFYITLVLIALVMLSGCAEHQAVSTAPATLEAPTATPAATPTATPTATAMPTATATPTPETPVAEATVTPTAEPTTDPAYDAAWNTFLEVIYRCDAMPDLGDDLSLYPQDAAQFKTGVTEILTDAAWLTRCEENSVLQRLAEFNPKNLNCTGATCEAAVSVTSTGGLAFFEPWCAQNPEQCAALTAEQYTQLQTQRVMIYRPPHYQDSSPLRLIKGTVELQEGQWVITRMEVEVLTTTSEKPSAPSTAAPMSDYDAAWNTFLEVIYRCDAMPDLGDDLSLYPPLAEFDMLHDGIEQLTTDAYWQERCEQRRVVKRLAEFGPQNLECEGLICEAVVSVQSQGGLANYEGELIIARPPKYQDYGPFRLLRGTVELQGEQWVVTKMGVEVLTPPTEEAMPLDETAGLSQ